MWNKANVVMVDYSIKKKKKEEKKPPTKPKGN